MTEQPKDRGDNVPKSKVTMIDIARQTGVSQSTVSLILSGKESHSFSPETVRRVKAVADQLGYQKRWAGPAEKRTIMVLSVNYSNPYYCELLQGIEAEAADKNYNVISCNTHRNPRQESQYLEMALSMKLWGIIVLFQPQQTELFGEVVRKIPAVCICDREDAPAVDIIEMNNVTSGRLLIDYLYSLGHQKIALITSSLGENKGRFARMDGLRLQMERLGLKENFSVIMDEGGHATEIRDFYSDYHIGYRLMQDEALYKSGTTAFVCTNDMVAFGAMDAILERGYRIPEDFSLCGFDNLLYAQFSPVSLTSVDHGLLVKGKSAFELLLRKVEALEANGSGIIQSDIFRIEFLPKLIIRDSTGPASPLTAAGKPPKSAAPKTVINPHSGWLK